MAIVINVANFKGGVGKTTTVCLLGYSLADLGYKTLVVDMDPQANATEMLTRTYNIDRVEKTLYQAMQQKDLSYCLMELGKNLHLIPAELDLVGFPMLLNEMAGEDTYKRAYFLDFLLTSIKDDYDFIIIDVPPTISDYTNNAVVASDYVLIVMQTHERSLAAAEKLIPYLEGMNENYNANVSLLGVVPVLMKNDGTVDNYIIEESKKSFGKNLLNTTIFIRERIKRWDVHGITSEDIHDWRSLNMYHKLTKEILERLGFREEERVVNNG